MSHSLDMNTAHIYPFSAWIVHHSHFPPDGTLSKVSSNMDFDTLMILGLVLMNPSPSPSCSMTSDNISARQWFEDVSQSQENTNTY
ncbi:MAG: hypothetical protein R2685_11450 [Candidatus Nitrosocosmicus sp.]|nr:hypothetical protein [Candidatus Nitrosocosmicus sp.]